MSKRIWEHPAAPPDSTRKLWRSFGELDDTPEFRTWVEREFPQGAGFMADESDAGQTRRDFLKLMGASTALAGFGLAACRRPETRILPYSKNLEWMIPGKPLYYATSMPWKGGAMPVVATTYEGRPTHLQGNALHPESVGGLDSFAQASVLDLYDPDRARYFTKDGKDASRDEFLAFLDGKKAELTKDGGKGLALLLDEVSSPTRARLTAKVQAKFPQAKVYRYEAITNANQQAATELLFGKNVRQVPHFSVCSRVLSLDNDFLANDAPKANSACKFMEGRKVEKQGDTAAMNRLYVLESRYTLTGGMADHRLRVHASQTMKAAVALAKEIAAATGDSALQSATQLIKLKGDYSPREDYAAWIREAAKDLAAAPKGTALVLAGSQQPQEVHVLTALINQALGAYTKAEGKGVPPIELKQIEAAEAGSLEDLAAAVGNKEVAILAIISAADPCYDAPASLKWEEKQKSIPTVISVAFRDMTATARASHWVVPGTHYLEQWGDLRSLSGVYSVIQPMIQPLYGGISDLEFLSWLASDEPVAVKPEEVPPAAPMNGALPEESKDPGYLAVRETFAALAPQETETAWSNALRDGLLPGTKWPDFGSALNAAAATPVLSAFADIAPPSAEAFEVTLIPDEKVFDGRYINNAWLQEAPHTITKLTWDNAALVSVRTATDLGLNKYLVDKAETITITVAGQELTVPVLVAPGHADNAITLALGYGQAGKGLNGPGRVGEDTGFNVYPLRDKAATYWLPGATVAKTGKTVPMALTQEHHTMYGREIYREGTAERFEKNPAFAATEGMDSHIPPDYSFYKPTGAQPKQANGQRGLLANTPHSFDTLHQWGMVIDLNSCIGCNACLIACQSENNIPVVGKRQVIIGREMHWVRMDRYFAVDLDGGHNTDGKEWDYPKNGNTAGAHAGGAGDEHAGHGERIREIDDPEMLIQPVSCQQCESAPCETVCPVNATVHSEDGLNLMVYNRCIGTRYCANNCPYKVRRFNYFDYNKRDPLLASDGKSRDNAKEHEGFFDILHENNLYRGPLAKKKEDISLRLQRNPNVTVRMRGVIEKCTYCIQRLEAAKIEQKKVARAKAAHAGVSDENLVLDEKDLRVPTDKIKVACQAACPVGGVAFGNLLDNDSQVSKIRGNTDFAGGIHEGSPRNYQLLRYIGTKPRTSYLARIKNPNPDLLKVSPREARKVGQASANI